MKRKSQSRPAERETGEEGTVLTESVNPASVGIDGLDSRGILEVIHREDSKAWEAIGGALDTIAGVVDGLVQAFREGGRLLYVGAGTSGRLGVLDAAECPPTFGVSPDQVVGILAGGDPALRRSVEGAEDSAENGARAVWQLQVGPRDVLCGIAASGTTPYVLGALKEGKRRGARTVLITCNPLAGRGSESPTVDHTIQLLVGPEVIAGSTRMKAGTATKMVLNMITTAAMIRCGKVYDNLMVDVRPVSRKLQRRAVQLVTRIAGASRERAVELLERSRGDVKTAIVMARRGISVEEARSLLERARGLLRTALEAPSKTDQELR